MNNLESLQKLMEETMAQLQGYIDLIKQLQNEAEKNKEYYNYNMSIRDQQINELKNENKELKSYMQSTDGLVKLYDKNESLKNENETIKKEIQSTNKTNSAYLLEIYDKDAIIAQKDEKIQELNGLISEHVNKEVE